MPTCFCRRSESAGLSALPTPRNRLASSLRRSSWNSWPPRCARILRRDAACAALRCFTPPPQCVCALVRECMCAACVVPHALQLLAAAPLAPGPAPPSLTALRKASPSSARWRNSEEIPCRYDELCAPPRPTLPAAPPRRTPRSPPARTS